MSQPLGSSYELDALIGRGGMGEVWRGRSKDGHSLAFKLMIPDLAQDEALVARFLRERSILTRLDSPYVVQVYDMVAESGRLAIVMQLVDGQDLRTELARVGTFAPADALRLISLVLRGVAAAHALGITHRDLKPGNVLLTRDQAGALSPKVSDFGIAAMAEGATRLTSSSAVVGTPIYMAPEQADHGDAGPAADLYSAGIMLYELLAGVPPFTGRPMAVLRAHAEREPGRIPGLSDEVWHLLMGLLAKDPAARFPSASAAADAMEQLSPRLADVPPLPRLDAPPASYPSPVPASTTVHVTTVTGPRPVGEVGSDPHPAPVPIQPPGSRSGSRTGLYVGIAAAVAVVLALVAVVVSASSGGGEGPGVSAGSGGQAPSSIPSVEPTPSSAVGSPTLLGGVETPSSPPATTSAQPEAGVVTYLEELRPIQGYWTGNDSVMINGNSYPHSLLNCLDSVDMEYNLGRKYKTLETTIGISDETPTGATAEFEFFVDGRAVETVKVTRGDAKKVDILLNEALTLDIKVRAVSLSCGGGAALGEAKLLS